ncbi:helix-turn-helix domain-containing protein [Oscillochloris sp. ZM17-4]|uniref:WD40 domain-containing protein n=1 Tax=Oscillochloris sp. ZM17-4 TaxID=2866714 RepID=UPI001C733C78|nr:NB-ARC domain-containing protein [Oscillochloris sp. ZM17-4]MBX0328910.1 helix-turn-helix domain-containing protein [Oscillochloris sp. ZM17-4]
MSEEPPVIPLFQRALGDHALGIYLADLRAWVFRSQARAADHFGLSRSTVWRYEEGQSLPPPGYLAALAQLVAERLGGAAAGGPPYALLLQEINRAMVTYYPNTPPYDSWDDVARAAAGYDAGRRGATNGQAADSATPPAPLPAHAAQVDWGDAPEILAFYGRQRELAELQRLIGAEGCRVLGVLGMGGVGKTALAARLAELIADQFDLVVWRSLANAPPPSLILRELLQLLASPAAELPPAADQLQVRELLPFLQSRRCLLILDNYESIIEGGERAGTHRAGYESYGQLLRLFGQARHQSCLILTSRELPRELATLSQAHDQAARIRTFSLSGLDHEGALSIFRDAGLDPSDPGLPTLFSRCSGNPKILAIVAAAVRDFYDGSVATFLERETIIFDDVRDILRQQFARLSAAEQEIMYWLALAREPLSLSDLHDRLLVTDTGRHVLETVRSLQRRSLIERDLKAISLQNAVAEYVVDLCIARVNAELRDGTFEILHQHALIRAQARDYVRASQERVVLQPLAERLLRSFSRQDLERHLERLLEQLRTSFRDRPSYAGGNLLNLLIFLGSELAHKDLSHLAIWQAHLMGVALHYVNMRHADLRGSVFTETFGSVRTVAFSPDGQLMAAGSSNGEIHVWRTNTYEHRFTLDGQTWVETLAFSPDSRLLASGSADPAIQLWDCATGTLSARLEGHVATVRSLCFSPDGALLASAGDGSTLRLWDMEARECRAALRGQRGTIWSVAFHPGGHLLASAGDGILLWDVAGGRQVARLDEHQAPVAAVAFSPDGATLASASYDHSIKLWDIPAGRCRTTLHGHTGDVRAVAFRPDGTALVSGSEDQRIRMWDPASGEARGSVHEPANRVRALAFSADGALLASGSHDQNVRLWDIEHRQCLTLFQGHINQLRTLAISPDGRSLALGVAEQIYLLDPLDGVIRRRLPGHAEWIQSLAFSPDGALLASGSDDHSVRIWHVYDGAPAQLLCGHQAWVQAVAYSADGRLLASCSADHTVCLWDAATGALRQTLRAHTHHVWTVAFSPDGAWLASAGADETIRLWDLHAATCQYELPGHSGSVWSLAFTPDSRRLVSGGHDRLVNVWDIQQGRRAHTLAGHENRVVSVAVSPDGRWIASGGDDRTVRIWDLRSGGCVHIGRGHRRAVVSLTFSPDAALVYSGGEDGAVRVWGVQSGACVRTLTAPRPYDGLVITGAVGLTSAQRSSLLALGATDS